MARAEVLRHVAGLVADQVRRQDRCLVAVDGADGAGKTWFARDLVALLALDGTTVASASVDGFHHPRALRYARGRRSPEGYRLDAFDLRSLRRELLGPWRSGAGGYRTAVHDVATDLPVDDPAQPVPARGVLVVDGVFLLRDELADLWDVAVRLEVGAEERFRRMSLRDGSPADPAHPDNRRYLVAHRRYEQLCAPAARADVVVDATEPADLRVLPRTQRRRVPGGPGVGRR